MELMERALWPKSEELNSRQGKSEGLSVGDQKQENVNCNSHKEKGTKHRRNNTMWIIFFCNLHFHTQKPTRDSYLRIFC